MRIELQEVGKRFRRDWIFRSLSKSLEGGKRYAVVGPNGSGKSTLMRVLAGALMPTEGSISWSRNSDAVKPEEVFQHLSWAAPYLDPPRGFSLLEALDFQARIHPWMSGMSSEDVVTKLGLERHRHKMLSDFSSGMFQRVRLGLAFYRQSELLLLDEPTTNLDEAGTQWFEQELEAVSGDRLIVIASNRPREYASCTEEISVGRAQ